MGEWLTAAAVIAGSNIISIPLDSLLFNLIAFAGVFAPMMLTAIIFGEIVTKFTTGALAALWRAPKDLPPKEGAAPLHA